MSDADIESLLQRFPEGEPMSPDHRQELRQRVLEEFDNSRPRADTSFARRLLNKGRLVMLHPLSRAASLVAAVMFCVWVLSPVPASAAFEKMIKPLVEAKTAKYKAIVKMEGQKEMTLYGSFLAPGRIRQENKDVISILDMETLQMLTLTPLVKQALVIEASKKSNAPRSESLFGSLRKILEDYRANKSVGVKDLGEKQIDGRKAFGFAVNQAGVTTEIWGDAKTSRLIRIESTFAGQPHWTSVMTDFEFDVPLDEKQFSLDPPEGYKVVKVKLNPDPATEAEFVEALKKLAEMNKGELVGGLDSANMAMAFVKGFEDEPEDKDGPSEEAMKVALDIGRGLTFANMLPAESDAHYAGRGVKIGEEPKPVFWYKPEEAGKYRVLSSNWTWSETDTPPSVKNSIKLGGFPKSAFKKNGK